MGAAPVKLRNSIAALLACALPGFASAQPIQGFYLSGGAGLHLPYDTRVTPLLPGLPPGFNLVQQPGYAASLAVGYALGNGMRFELEGTTARAKVKSINGLPFAATASGTVRNTGLMVNALFDMDVGSPYVFPYLGVGAGYQMTHLDALQIARTGTPGNFGASGDQGTFGVQAIGGFSFPVRGVPGLSVTLDYRLMDIARGGRFSANGPSPSVPGTFKFRDQVTQDVILGVRYAFDTPMPAALVAATQPAPAAVQSWLVYFDLDKAALTARPRAIVREAASASVKTSVTRIEVAGNTGRSGDNAYNPALSERRARAVAAALVADGVPKEAIGITALGETKPLVPTAKGAVEARNRRVEIVAR